MPIPLVLVQRQVMFFVYLVISEHSEDVKFWVRGKALTLPHTGNDPRHKCAMAKTWIQDKRLIIIQQTLSLTRTHSDFFSLVSALPVQFQMTFGLLFLSNKQHIQHVLIGIYNSNINHSKQYWDGCLHLLTPNHHHHGSLTIIQCLFIRPVGPLLHVLKMWVLLAQACIEHCNLHTRALSTYT